MLKHRFFRADSKGGIAYNENLYGTKASFNSYLDGFQTFCEEKDKEDSPASEITQIVVQGSSQRKNNRNVLKSDSVTLAEPKPVIEVDKKPLQKCAIGSDPISTVPEKSRIFNSTLSTLNHLRKGNNLQKFLEEAGFSIQDGVSVKKLRQGLENFMTGKEKLMELESKEKEIRKYTNQLETLRQLRDEKELKKWLESLGLPATNISITRVKAELDKYFGEEKNPKRKELLPTLKEPSWGKRLKDPKLTVQKSEDINDKSNTSSIMLSPIRKTKSLPDLDKYCLGQIPPKKSPQPTTRTRKPRNFGPPLKLEEFKGRSIFLQESTLANKIWEEFKGMSTAKQVGIVIGITVVTAALGWVSWRILIMAFPSAFSNNRYWAEVLASWFLQRQESTFNLLQHTAANAKPLSTAWANQYILWKYI